MRARPFAAAAGALAVGALTLSERGGALDRRAYRALNRAGRPGADAVFGAITELGSIWASCAAAATLAVTGRRREALDAFGAAGAMWVLGQAAKKAVLRPRPYDAVPAIETLRLLIDRPRGTSWPSSHPAVLFAFATVAVRDLDAPAAVRVGSLGVVGAVALSRVSLGVHYPADVLGGVLLGWAVADLWSELVSPHIVEHRPRLVLLDGDPRAPASRAAADGTAGR